jgi:hypothetical protein
MAFDDGAILQVDGKSVIDLDGLHSVNAASGYIHLDPGLHKIHVPYYQGDIDSVVLELWVMLPGAKDWMLFDLNDYGASRFKSD